MEHVSSESTVEAYQIRPNYQDGHRHIGHIRYAPTRANTYNMSGGFRQA